MVLHTCNQTEACCKEAKCIVTNGEPTECTEYFDPNHALAHNK